MTIARLLRESVGGLFCVFLIQIQPVWGQVAHPLAVSINVGNWATGYGTITNWALPYRSGPDTVSTTDADEGWFAVHWDNKRFNPYDESDVEFPFKVTFDESRISFPMKRKMVVTSHYGWRNGVLHRGIDLDLVTGDDVFALMDGKVRYVRHHAGHGKTVVVRHNNGLETVYAHLSRQLVEEDQLVQKGQVIGKGGTTGNARGSHLHLEVRYKGVTLNPEYFFDFEKSNKVRSLSSWMTEDYADPRNYSSSRVSGLPILVELPSRQDPVEEVGTKKLDAIVSTENAGVRDLRIDKSKDVSTPETDMSLNTPETYTIQYGDTLYSLARTHHTTVEDICRVNGIKDSFKIQVGQKIVID